MSKKKAPALHERRGREDISTRPPRLAGCPIKLAGKCPFAPAVSGSGFVREPKVLWRGPRRRSTENRAAHNSTIRHAPPKARRKVFARSSPGSHEEHIKCSSARAELATNITKTHRATCQPSLFSPGPCVPRVEDLQIQITWQSILIAEAPWPLV